ncbi:MAG: hypothetical protein ACRD3W_19320 [Terriglobales bacterium]
MNSRQTNKTVQLTIRGVSTRVKKLLADRAESERKSLNAVLVEALSSAAGVGADNLYSDLDHLAGRWIDDPGFDAAIAAQDTIDESIWQ